MIILSVYAGSYLMLVNLPSIDHIATEPTGRVEFQTVDRYYSHGGKFAEVHFWPIEQLDRQIRKNAWRT